MDPARTAKKRNTNEYMERMIDNELRTNELNWNDRVLLAESNCMEGFCMLYKEWRRLKKKSNGVVVELLCCLLDFSSAFESLYHDLIQSLDTSYGLIARRSSGFVFTQFIYIISSPYRVFSCLPHCSVFGPFIFSICVLHVGSNIKSFGRATYIHVDSGQMYSSYLCSISDRSFWMHFEFQIIDCGHPSYAVS